VECALQLHPLVRDRLDEIERVELRTQEPAIRIISKTGPLHGPADRDHCLQYRVAVALIHGQLTAECYEDGFASDSRLDALRAKMPVAEEPRFTRDDYDPDRRSIGNSVQVWFRDGSATPQVVVESPLGHRRRRQEGLPLLLRKFRDALATRYPRTRAGAIDRLCQDAKKLEATPVHGFTCWSSRLGAVPG
jgi:2-methylcitrate dehydratase